MQLSNNQLDPQQLLIQQNQSSQQQSNQQQPTQVQQSTMLSQSLGSQNSNVQQLQLQQLPSQNSSQVPGNYINQQPQQFQVLNQLQYLPQQQNFNQPINQIVTGGNGVPIISQVVPQQIISSGQSLLGQQIIQQQGQQQQFYQLGVQQQLSPFSINQQYNENQDLVVLFKIPEDANNSLYVEGVPSDSTQREVAHIFRPFPGYLDTRLIKKKAQNGREYYFCFIDFDTSENATIALQTLQGYRFDKNDKEGLKINYAKEKQDEKIKERSKHQSSRHSK